MAFYDEEAELGKYTGKRVDIELFKEFFTQNFGEDFDCTSKGEYICYFNDLLDTPKQSLVKITETLQSSWEYRGVDFRLNVYFDDSSNIETACLSKYREDDHGHFKANVTELTPTKQEVRIAKRVLDLCIKKDIE